MMLVAKLERALAFAKELGLNDDQTKELMSIVLEIPSFKINWNPPNTPWWTPPNTSPSWPGIDGGTTIIGPGYITMPFNKDLEMHDPVFGTMKIGCSCSPVGQLHSDNCKAIGVNEGRSL